MKKEELFKEVAKYIAENHALLPLESDIEDVLSSFMSGYCPTCGSCGETGCCSPDKCNEVICFYGENNLREYKDLLEENTRYYRALENIMNITSEDEIRDKAYLAIKDAYNVLKNCR